MSQTATANPTTIPIGRRRRGAVMAIAGSMAALLVIGTSLPALAQVPEPPTGLTVQGGVSFPPPSGNTQTRLGISGDNFTINGTPTFLLGVSYFQALNWHQSDIDALDSKGYNWIRIWLEHCFDTDLAALLSNGSFVGAAEIEALVDYCDDRGIIVEIVLMDWESMPVSSAPLTAIDNVTAVLADKTNIFYDVVNEHNLFGNLSHSTITTWVSRIRAGDADAIITTSSSRGHLGGAFDNSIITADVDTDLATGVDFLGPHFNRDAGWDTGTDERVDALKDYLVSIRRDVPVLLTEEARIRSGASSQSQFETALTGCIAAGCAGWLFHNDANFDMSSQTLFQQLDPVELATIDNLPRIAFPR
jgi:hypothetical protein